MSVSFFFKLPNHTKNLGPHNNRVFFCCCEGKIGLDRGQWYAIINRLLQCFIEMYFEVSRIATCIIAEAPVFRYITKCRTPVLPAVMSGQYTDD